MTIRDCGEILPGEDWNYWDIDKTGDKLPPFPEDWEQNHHDFTVNFKFYFHILQISALLSP